MKISGPVTLAEVKQMVRKTDRSAYIKLPPDKRKRYLEAYKKCDENDDNKMPKKGSVAFDLLKFAMLFQIIEDSLSAEHKERAEELTVAITQILTARPIRLSGVAFGLVRVRPSMVIYNPMHPSLSPATGPDDIDEEEEDDGY